jgi:DNA-binding GntR family transcriptional regulator
VQPFRREEVQQLYPLVGALEAWGLRQGGGPGPGTLESLETLRVQIQDPDLHPADRQRLDLHWHEALLAPCANDHLKRMISDLKGLLHRYELAYMATPVLLEASSDDHQRILGLLARGQLSEAAATLEHHWVRSMEALLPLLAPEVVPGPVSAAPSTQG